MIKAASDVNISLPKCQIYLEKVGVHGLLEAYAEIRQYINIKDGFRFNYEDSNRLSNYVESFILSKQQMMLLESIDIETLKKFSHDYFHQWR